MATKQYWLRMNGKVFGPYDDTTIRQMAAAATLRREMEISSDNVTWHIAGNVKGLFTPQPMHDFETSPAQPPREPPQPRPAPRKFPKMKWIAAIGVAGIIWMAIIIGGKDERNPNSPEPEDTASRVTQIDEKLLATGVWNCHTYNWKGQYRFRPGSFEMLLRTQPKTPPSSKDPDLLTVGGYRIDGTTIYLLHQQYGLDMGVSTTPQQADGQNIPLLGLEVYAKAIGNHIFAMSPPNPEPVWNAIRVSELSKASMRAEHIWTDPAKQPAEFERVFTCELLNASGIRNEQPSTSASLTDQQFDETSLGQSKSPQQATAQAAPDADRAVIEKFISTQAKENNGSEYVKGRQLMEGDLNNDGVPDVVVIYTIGMNGGNGSTQYLSVFVRTDGRLIHTSDEAIGGYDRSIVGGAVIANTITLRALERGPDDPDCCLSKKVVLLYVLSNGKLNPLK